MVKNHLFGAGRKCTFVAYHNDTKMITEEEVKERIACSYFGGVIDSGGTIGVVKVGAKKREVPIVRIRRGHEYALTWMKKKWGGSVIKRGDAFEITMMYGKAVVFLRAIRNNSIARQGEIDRFLAKWEKVFVKEELQTPER